MFGNPYTLFILELCKHCGEPSPSSSQVGTHPLISTIMHQVTILLNNKMAKRISDFRFARFRFENKGEHGGAAFVSDRQRSEQFDGLRDRGFGMAASQLAK